jgi:hypothetical protein
MHMKIVLNLINIPAYRFDLSPYTQDASLAKNEAQVDIARQREEMDEMPM